MSLSCWVWASGLADNGVRVTDYEVIVGVDADSGSGVFNVISDSSKLFQITLLLDGTIILCNLLL